VIAAAAFADWANVGATLVGSLGSTGALIVAYRLLRRESQRDQARDIASQQQQADNVSAWSTRSHVYVRNASNLPIYDVLLTFTRTGVRTYGCYIVYLGVVPPDTTIARRLPGTSIPGQMDRSSYDAMAFRDASGYRWQRTDKGYISELPLYPSDRTLATGERSSSQRWQRLWQLASRRAR